MIAQTRRPDEIIALASDVDLSRLSEQFSEVRFIEQENKSDWGHDKRAKGLDLATSDYIGWFNHDDSYSREYIGRMMSAVESGFDVAFCAWNSNTSPEFRASSSTSGNYIVKASVGRSAGYYDRHYEADGTFINRIAEKTSAIKFIPEVLYFHNEVK